MAKGDKKNNYITHGRVSENRRVRFDYEILETFDAGLVLTGPEVKSLRLGHCSLQDAFAMIHDGEIILQNFKIDDYKFAKHDQKITPTRQKKLLITKTERRKLIGRIKKEGISVIPMEVFFNEKGIAKCKMAIGKGKNLVDKRQTIKTREWDRQKARVMKGE